MSDGERTGAGRRARAARRAQGGHPRRARRSGARWPRRPGCRSIARDIRETRLPKLDDERFTVVVLGEFNHGKSTFINALLGAPVLPTGHHARRRPCWPTSRTGRARRRDAGLRRRARARPIDGRARSATGSPSRGWPARVARPAKTAASAGVSPRRAHPPRGAAREPADHRRHAGRQRHQRAARRDHLRLPAARRRGGLPARRDADPDRLRAAVPRGAHPALDARPADVRRRQDRPARRRPSWTRRWPSRASTWRRSSPSRRSSRSRPSARWPAIAPGRGWTRFVAALGATVENERRRLLLDHALADAARALGLRAPEPGHSPPLAGAAAARAGAADRPRQGAAAHRQEGAGDGGRRPSRAETAGAQGARAPGSGRLHRRAARARSPPTSTRSRPATSGATCRSSCRTPGRPGPRPRASCIAAELERLAEKVIQVANENVREVARRASRPSSARPTPRSTSASTR